MSSSAVPPTAGRGSIPLHLVTNPPPAPSRSPSNASTGGEVSGGDPEDESADESDFPEDDNADPDASSLSLSLMSPATPKPAGASWPFSAPGAEVDMPYTDDEEDYIPASSLPHEILLHILRLLPSSSLAPALRVCKAWCQCGVELLWHKPMFKTLPSLYRMLQVLTLPDQTFPYPEFVRRLNFNNLHGEMSDRMLAKLLPCTKIERLTLTGCKGLTSAAMVSLLAQSKRIIALDLSDVENVDDAVLEAMARNCPRLQGLNMSGCTKITDRGLEPLAVGCPSLRRIKLRKCDNITDVPIILLSLHCPLLLEVDLASCTAITALSVMQLLRTSRALRELSLPSCLAITDDGFPDAENLILSVPSIHDAVEPPTDNSIFSSYTQFIEESDVQSDSVEPIGNDKLATTIGALIPLPQPLRSPPTWRPYDHLRYLDITSCALVTDQSIAGIVKYAPRLRNLILAKCSRLTDDALFEICKIGKHLHYLHLGHVSTITDRAVTAIARSCTRLRYIDLACCNNLTDLSVFELAANLPRLKRIGLVRVTNITDEAIYSLHVRTSLERIHLSYCDNLTVGAVNEMLQQLPRLTHLSLTGVSSFRKRALQQFCRPPPRDFNDHQRRSFCVFSGRGVVDLRRYLRSLPPAELAALALPDPTPDILQQNPPPNAPQSAAAIVHAANAAIGQAGQQFAQTQARLQQIQQARQAVAQATVRLQQHQHARGAGGGGPPVIAHAQQQAHAPNPWNGQQQQQPTAGQQPQLAPAPTLRPRGGNVDADAASLLFHGQPLPQGAFSSRRPTSSTSPVSFPASGSSSASSSSANLTNGNMLGLQHAGPSAQYARASTSSGTEQQPVTPRNAAGMDIDVAPIASASATAGAAAAGRANGNGNGNGNGMRRARGATVTRRNYVGGEEREAEVEEAAGGSGGSASEGEEEDISMEE